MKYADKLKKLAGQKGAFFTANKETPYFQFILNPRGKPNGEILEIGEDYIIVQAKLLPLFPERNLCIPLNLFVLNFEK